MINDILSIVVGMLVITGCGDKESISASSHPGSRGLDARADVLPTTSGSECESGSIGGFTSPSGYSWEIVIRNSRPRLELISGNHSLALTSSSSSHKTAAWALSLPLDYTNESQDWSVYDGEAKIGSVECLGNAKDEPGCMTEGASISVTIGAMLETGLCLLERG